MTVLEAHELYRFFHVGDEETAALRGVSVTVARGETVAVMGLSGSGKSTLLNCLTGLDEPDAGMVMIDGKRMSRRPEYERARLRARSCGILLQSGNLFQHFTVAENIRFQMMLLGAVDEKRLHSLLETAGIEKRSDAYPAHLSGGETARAGLAVALANNPPLLIADEPTAEVDVATESRLLDQFDTRRDAGLATLIATHSEALANRANRIVRLKDGRLTDE
ncbi:ATP-binding cassette domain-containing protein [Oricola nitratireducens]|uniref:ATP-binding cassette domain-containing protein n=1 Tax=Oricola nitratireducens TaxID=2775868 RepID=UPI001867ED79